MLNTFARMIPRLQAEEALRHSMSVALGSGNMKKHDARRLSREWEKMVQSRRNVKKPRTPQELQWLLQSAGIGMKDVSSR